MVRGKEVVKANGLVYVTDQMEGFYRKGDAGKFYYVDKLGHKVKDAVQLERIQKLVIPPAWQQVWIAGKPNAYLQATGIDAAGRKQYKYHTKWISRRSDHKYFRLLEFARALPRARKQLAKDLKRTLLDEQKVLAICVDVLQKSLIRVGNESYKQLYGSYGLTTLRDKHVHINGSKIKMDFIGKKGVKQAVELTDRRLATLIKKCRDIPGQTLFQYYTDDKKHRNIDSGRINQYIREITGGDFTAKDFRTWGGTLEALRQLARCEAEGRIPDTKKMIISALDCVAKTLGNTRSVCKSSYVYPLLLAHFEKGTLHPYLKKINGSPADQANGLMHDEKILRSFLKSVSK